MLWYGMICEGEREVVYRSTCPGSAPAEMGKMKMEEACRALVLSLVQRESPSSNLVKGIISASKKTSEEV